MQEHGAGTRAQVFRTRATRVPCSKNEANEAVNLYLSTIGRFQFSDQPNSLPSHGGAFVAAPCWNR
jgi:hypothetical protein